MNLGLWLQAEISYGKNCFVLDTGRTGKDQSYARSSYREASSEHLRRREW
jgi:hypothetical protein